MLIPAKQIQPQIHQDAYENRNYIDESRKRREAIQTYDKPNEYQVKSMYLIEIENYERE